MDSRRVYRRALVLALAAGLGRAAAAQATPAATSDLAGRAAAITSGDTAAAWQAVNALRGFQVGDSRERKECQKLVATWSTELATIADERQRVVRAHALGAFHALGEPATAALADRCAHDPAGSVRLACALALAEIGEGAFTATAKILRPDDLVGGALACGVFGRSGTRSAVATNLRGVAGAYPLTALRNAASHAATFREFVLAESALTALEALGEDVRKLREDREGERRTLAVPTAAGLNWSGLGQQVPETFFSVFREALSLPNPVEAFARPAALRPLPQGRLYDQYADALAHLTRIGPELLPELEKGALATFDGYVERTRSWVLTLDLLIQAEERFVPLEEKKR